MGEQTRGEAELLSDLNEFVRQSANLQSEVPETSGIRPHPLVESTEQTLDTTRFGFGFGPKPLAEVEPESGGGEPGGCPTAPCHAIGTIHLAVEGDRYGSVDFNVDDDFVFSSSTLGSIDLQTTIEIRKTSDDTLCNLNDPSIVNLHIQVSCNPETNKWDIQIIGSIGAWLCPFEDCAISGSVLFASEYEELGTLPQDVELTISGTYTCGTITGTATLRISETCGVFGACAFECPTPCIPNKTEDGCIALGGTWQGEGSECTPCGGHDVCCIEGVCYEDVTEAECDEAGGTYIPDSACDPDPC